MGGNGVTYSNCMDIYLFLPSMNDKAKRFSLCVSLLDCRHTNSLAFKTNLIRVGRLIQRSAVRVTAVTVTVGYSDRFGNPRFITNKAPLLTVTKNRLQ